MTSNGKMTENRAVVFYKEALCERHMTTPVKRHSKMQPLRGD